MVQSKQKRLLLPWMRLMLFGMMAMMAFYNVNAVPSKRNSIKACGQELTDMAFTLCKGRFKGYPKRGSLDLFDYVEQQNGLHNDNVDVDVDVDDADGDGDADEPNSDAISIWANALRNYKFAITTTRRPKRGIVDECCHKPCALSEMRNYCAR